MLPTNEAKPVMEALPGDFAGYVIRGQLLLDIEGDESRILRTGDAFYVKAGRPLRGHALGDEPARLITVQSVPRGGKKK